MNFKSIFLAIILFCGTQSSLLLSIQNGEKNESIYTKKDSSLVDKRLEVLKIGIGVQVIYFCGKQLYELSQMDEKSCGQVAPFAILSAIMSILGTAFSVLLIKNGYDSLQNQDLKTVIQKDDKQEYDLNELLKQKKNQ